ncbi:MAG: hypothetical protein A2Y45_01350 [Tenericutes bacterium GWC2_34_14]|nr:MAG: hypothetical protein A2Z84_08385 [Tenericutes bacterium GWA2_35_7]OHE28185.1 MAG: hypothetical protein A2Y45_01350 [Tenericutes bacterium GWC2_34_14]OHE33189.1 MAG: hypothetical protein A2012_00730 [Tenericutes bacterium GWE2_34_108]OHE36309.1 MAG: hypothetical protein A2Y46_07720 [Tenericutes bacterium GWF1_35_14]OHE38649.1 MAG: hypothetical protein A2Y44_04510 [Tenericutes bacterium GWF2_35_184]OHE42414.1 MAG: hypothetical protein A3K26_09820 [Tenericutes bacterium RIFOXYA12_FULL_35_
MAIIRVKRGTTKPTTAQLNYLGELAFDYNNNALYARTPSSVVKIGGEMELVYTYEGYAYTHTLSHAFDPDYIYKVHIISSTYCTSADISDTYVYYRTGASSTLTGSYLNYHASTESSVYQTRSVKNSTVQYIEDSYESGPTITSGITKVISFEISPTFRSSLSDVIQWNAYGKSVTTLSGQGNTTIKSCDFVHSVNGSLGQIYINTGLNLGSPDILSISLYRTKRK